MTNNLEQCYGVDCFKCKAPCELQACGINVIREKRETLARSNGNERNHASYCDEMGPALDNEAQLFAALDLTDEMQPEDRRQLLEAVNRLAHLYLEFPRIFEMLIRHIYQGETQADLARRHGISRNAVSKSIRRGVADLMHRELGLRTPVAEREKLQELTPEEFVVYKLLFLNGCTIRSAAAQLGMSKSKVGRAGQVLRRKLAKSGTKKRAP